MLPFQKAVGSGGLFEKLKILTLEKRTEVQKTESSHQAQLLKVELEGLGRVSESLC